jgi:SAM-dependent methyltransferase
MDSAEGYVTDVSYISGFYPNMSPLAMRYVAALNKVTPPQVGKGFRYLELGCGLGRSLTTLAAANPHGDFVGVDVNPAHTAAIEKDIAAGKLKNVRVVNADFAHVPRDIGKFDFIAIHGVLSWVTANVREQVLQVAKKHIAPGGLLLVSYNAMPGWAHLQPIRAILRQYAQLRQGASPQRLREALAYLVFIRDKQAKYFEDNPRAAAYVDTLLQQDVNYLVHEYLHEDWKCFYVAEVVEMMSAAANLGFVGSLPVFTNFWDLCVRPEFHELFRTTSNRLVTESHKDFCANTAFRWDIYGNNPKPMATLAERLKESDDFHYRVARRGITLPYQANLGVVTSTVQGALYQTLLGVLSDKSLRLSEIIAANELKGTPADEVMRAVDAGVAMAMFDVTSGPVATASAVPAKVQVSSPFNRTLMATESLGGRAVSLASEATGTGHALSDFDAAILHELVERGREQLAERVETRLSGSGRSLLQNGQPVVDAAARKVIVEKAVDAFLTTTLPLLVQLGIVTKA